MTKVFLGYTFFMDTTGLLTAQQVADLMNVHLMCVYQAIRDGRLPAQRIFGRTVVARADVETYLRRARPDGVKVKGRPKRQEAAL